VTVLGFVSTWDRAPDWKAALTALEPGLDFRIDPELGDARQIEAALVWKPRPGALATMPNLKVIVSLGAGVDSLRREEMPADVPVVRMIDPQLTRGMVEYVLYAVLRQHRYFPFFEDKQRASAWDQGGPVPDTARTTVGVMGIGVIGGAIARALREVGFAVRGWSRTPHAVEGIEGFHGADGLAPFLAECRHAVCVLPLTPATRGLIDARFLSLLPKGAHLINIGRGGHADEAAILAALDSGRLGHATLDVFHQEPLPAEHRFWRHPGVTLTPHVASLTLARTGAPHVIAAVRAVREGRRPDGLVDWARGY